MGTRVKTLHSAEEHDFSRGSMLGNIFRLSLPLILAQFINVLYNIVDRVYIGRLPGASAAALTGLGVAFPVITAITAFSYLVGTGGAPLCSIERGRGNMEKAGRIMGNSFLMTLVMGVLLTVVGFLIKDPLLYALGASRDTFGYANDYLSIYLLGTVCVMITLSMNGFINCQGFAGTGMCTVLIGAVINIILDPVFIFVFHMGVKGAAVATVISQTVSALWVVFFLRGKKTLLKLQRRYMKPDFGCMKEILALGLSGFIMAATNCAVQVVCNVTLQSVGGDVYVGIMTIVNSVREVLSVPSQGFTQGAQPVLGFNYGAREYGRVRTGIKIMSVVCMAYTTVVWIFTMLFPAVFIRLFNGGEELLKLGVPSMRIYFFGFCFMSLQFAGQSVFTALGKAKQAIFFSLLRKAVIVIPLTLWLPSVAGLGAKGVFLAEPISNFIGGTACFVTMLFVVLPELSRGGKRP